jgi:pentatricopeptide repeat protein
MDEKSLNKVVDHYCESGEFETAKRYINNFADNIPGFDKIKALRRVDALIGKAETEGKK